MTVVEQMEALEWQRLEGKDQELLAAHLNALFPSELAELVGKLEEQAYQKLFELLQPELAAETFTALDFSQQKELINTLPSGRAAALLNALDPDDRVAFFEGLSSPVVNELIKLLSPGERSATLKLLGYPEHSIGRLMTPDYIAVKMDWTIAQVLECVKKYGYHSETIDFLYVIDQRGHLIDDIKLIQLLFAPVDSTVEEFVDRKFIALLVTDEEGHAVNVFHKYGRLALPVVDSKGILLGIVTIDDILRVAEEVSTEDLQKFGGMEALSAPYLQTPFLVLIKKRVGWLTILFLGEMLTSTSMSFFQDTIAQAVVLTVFLPLIMSSGGNSGSQASTLIIRALVLDQIAIKDWRKVMRREIFSGLVLGTVLGAIAFARIALWSSFSTIYGQHWLLLAWTVLFTLISIVLWGTLSGSMLPLLLKKLKIDPAAASAPFVATLIDVTGIVIYFSIAYLILQGTLLS